VTVRREHGITVALGVSLVLAFVDLQWSSTLHYKIAQPDSYVYYLAAQLGRAHGWAAIYDPAVFLPPVTAAVGKPLPYLNPPELAWLVTPLSDLPYTLAGWIWTGLLAVALGLAWYLAAPARRLVRLVHGVGAAALLPVFVGVLFGQVSLVVVAAVAVSWWLLTRGRPWLAGLALSALILKPQMAFLVPLALLLSGYGRVVLAWVAVSVPLAIVTLLATGPTVLHHVSQSLHLVSGVAGPIQSSLLRQLPLPLAIVGIVLVLGVGALVLWRGRGSGPSLPITVGLISSVLVSPYINFYDLSALVLAAWLILRLSPPRWQQAVTFGMYVPLYGAPIWPLVTLACLCAWLISLAALPIRTNRESGTASRDTGPIPRQHAA
jgi:glycosyl transferase family 87